MDVKTKLEEAFDAVHAGERITAGQALQLYEEAPLSELGQAAFAVRKRLHPADQVSYLIDRNINYTNVCNSNCSFCGFYRPTADHPEAYTLSRSEIGEKIAEAQQLGATRILLQGGHNDELPYEFYIEMIEWITANYKIEVNAFSPSEIHQMHLVSGKSYFAILTDLKAAGMKGLPGGGAELLNEEIRMRVSPLKISGSIWLEIMAVAHQIGLTTSSTMVIGFGETIAQRVNHLERLRDLQDASIAGGHSGFGAFISWTLQHDEHTSMGRSRQAESYGADSVAYLRNVAVARIFLDNIPNHQASWPTLGAELGKVALHFGCNDFGSTMMEENVVSAAGGLTKDKWCMSPEELRGHIRSAGFVPVQRNTAYDLLEIFEATPRGESSAAA